MSKDRVMPQSPEIEQALLGALMLDPGVLTLVRQILSPSAFYLDQHRLIYQAMCDIDDRGAGCPEENADTNVTPQQRAATMNSHVFAWQTLATTGASTTGSDSGTFAKA